MSVVTLLFGPALRAQSADQEGADRLREVFGAPNFRTPGATLQFLKMAQDQRSAVPRDPAAFEAFLDRQPLTAALSDGAAPEMSHLIQWNAFALDLTSQDHTTVQPPEGAPSEPDPFYAEQFGPHRSSRALAIVHLAMFEAVNTIYRRAETYRGAQVQILAKVGRPKEQITPLTASTRRAIAVAAYDSLVALYPKKRALTEAVLRRVAAPIGDDQAMQVLGAAIGAAAASEILRQRKFDSTTGRFADGSEFMRTASVNNSLDLEPRASDLFPTPGPSDWQPDPITQIPKAIGGYWSHVEPFALQPNELFLPPGPPSANSRKFRRDYRDVRVQGGDPDPVPLGSRRRTPTNRKGTGATDPLDETNETFKANFWAYDGTVLLCAPPRLYNMIATSVALNEYKITEAPEMARYLALVNICLADAGISAWTAKYKFHFARPVSYIRLHQPDKVVDGLTNRDWTPLGAPASNGTPTGANLTPPFPSYPSGHAVFGGALFQAMKLMLPLPPNGKSSFSFVSDEYNGMNRGPRGEARPFVNRTFASFDAAAEENARSRIWLGIHWQFDGTDGIAQGERIATYIVGSMLKRI